MSLVSVVVDAVGPGDAVFVAKVDTGPVRVAVADNAGMSDPVFTASEAVDAQGVATLTISGLAPSSRFFYQVEDNGVLDTSVTGQFLTHPPVGSRASFTIGAASCAGLDTEFPGSGTELAPDRISNSPIFETIRAKAVAENWLFFGHLGDTTYYDPGSGVHVPDASVATYRTMYDDILAQSNQAGLYRDVPFFHFWDDHEFGPDNSDGTFVDKANAAQVFREREPATDFPDANAIYRHKRIGRTLIIGSDVRYDRSPNTDPDGPSKTMLGSAQKTWMENLLASTDAEFFIWLMPSQWMGTTTDSWSEFATERDELVTMLGDLGWLNRMCMVYGDRHAAGISSGATNDWGGFPVLQAASIDARPASSGAPGRFDVLEDIPSRDQYGTVTVTDVGSSILVKLSAWRGTDEIGAYSFGVALPLAPSVTVNDVSKLVSGSYLATFEARVLKTFQTGDDPDGTEIPILGGDVTYDATAETFGTLTLTTEGTDKVGDSLFPRRAKDLLAPYGTEVFCRRGIDLGGGGIVWVPLGYFRINEAEQGVDSDHPITLNGRDRMAGIVDAKLISPRQYGSGRTITSVVEDLVTDVYPNAVVAFDDTSGGQALGRQILVEEDRYAALRDIADSLGKVMFFDGEGILRILDAPDPEVISWEMKAGSNGVLVEASRRVSREGMFNAVVARGEGGDSIRPVQAVAVDEGPNSPTNWFGPTDPAQLWFGKVPTFYESPLLTDNDQARKAAESLLRRYIGQPYQVDFGVVPNPALRPYDVVRITHRDGNRERHTIDQVTVPLTHGATMTGATRVSTQLQVGQL